MIHKRIVAAYGKEWPSYFQVVLEETVWWDRNQCSTFRDPDNSYARSEELVKKAEDHRKRNQLKYIAQEIKHWMYWIPKLIIYKKDFSENKSDKDLTTLQAGTIFFHELL